jgi:hypothetical protein
LPIELPATAPPADIGFVTPPAAAGFVAVPPIEGAGFEAPPIALCLVLAGPPSAFWAEEGWETAVVNTPSDVTSNVTLNIALRFMDAILRAIGRPAIPSYHIRSRRYLIQYPGFSET